MTPYEIRVFGGAIKKYGLQAQMGMIQEKCGELITAVNHWRRGRAGAWENFIEELVDVKIVCEELLYYLTAHGHGSAVQKAYECKMDRLEKKLINKNPPSKEGDN